MAFSLLSEESQPSGEFFDAFTDPMIASWSDRCTAKDGRRIPFLKWASLPLALSTVLVFWSPINEKSWLNAAFLLVMVLAYYLSITAYCTPYNALIPELGHTQQERLNISTVISLHSLQELQLHTWHQLSGGAFIPAFGRVGAIRVTFHADGSGGIYLHADTGILHSGKGLRGHSSSKRVCFSPLTATFKNGEFCKFVGSDIFY